MNFDEIYNELVIKYKKEYKCLHNKFRIKKIIKVFFVILLLLSLIPLWGLLCQFKIQYILFYTIFIFLIVFSIIYTINIINGKETKIFELLSFSKKKKQKINMYTKKYQKEIICSIIKYVFKNFELLPADSLNEEDYIKSGFKQGTRYNFRNLLKINSNNTIIKISDVHIANSNYMQSEPSLVTTFNGLFGYIQKEVKENFEIYYNNNFNSKNHKNQPFYYYYNCTENTSDEIKKILFNHLIKSGIFFDIKTNNNRVYFRINMNNHNIFVPSFFEDAINYKKLKELYDVLLAIKEFIDNLS